MKAETHGWVVVNPKHPTTGKQMLVCSTFARTRKEAIELFIKGTTASWKFWRTKWNYQVVKAKSTIQTINP